MPLFSVEWKWSTEWTVEAATKEQAEVAALALRQVEVDPDGPDVWVSNVKRGKADAVVVDGEMLHPEDAARRRKELACEMIGGELRDLMCDLCGHTSEVEDWIARRCKDERIIGLDCPVCEATLSLEDCRCVVWRHLRTCDFDARQGRLYDE